MKALGGTLGKIANLSRNINELPGAGLILGLLSSDFGLDPKKTYHYFVLSCRLFSWAVCHHHIII